VRRQRLRKQKQCSGVCEGRMMLQVKLLKIKKISELLAPGRPIRALGSDGFVAIRS
jgi:hypothetical protein